MPPFVLFAYASLAAAAVLLAVEAWGEGRGPWRALGVGVYGSASVAGATLLTALAGREGLLAAALVPLTALAVVRFGVALAPGASPWRRAGWTALVLAVGIGAGLQAVPVPLTREHLTPASERRAPPTVRPHVGPPVRV